MVIYFDIASPAKILFQSVETVIYQIFVFFKGIKKAIGIIEKNGI